MITNRSYKRFKILLLLMSIIALTFLACAPQQAPAPASRIVEKPVPPATKAEASWEQQWEDLIKAAQREGRLSMYVNLDSEPIAAIRKNFGEKYGIALEIVSTRGSQGVAKVLMERQSGLYIPDVFVGGHTTAILEFKPRGILQPLGGVVFRPDVLDEKNWWRGYGPYYDKDHMVGGATRSVQQQILINTDMVRPGEIASYNDLLDPRWKDKIIIMDPVSIGGAGTAMLFALQIMGEDFIRKFREQTDVIVRDKRLGVEWVARGRYPIAFGTSEGIVDDFKQAGVTNLQPIILKEGTGVTATGVVILFDRAPHPVAAKLFINWFLTKEGQEVFVTSTARVSRRLDVSQDHIDPGRRMKEGVEYIVQDEEYYRKIVENEAIIAKYFPK